jgi:hypothetical protein
VARLRDRASGSIYSSDRRPDALRARGTHPALKMSSRVLPRLSPLSTAYRIWQHWQGVGCKERSPAKEAASQRQAPALNATYQVSLEVLPPASRLPARQVFLVAVCAVPSRPWSRGNFSTEMHLAVDGNRLRLSAMQSIAITDRNGIATDHPRQLKSQTGMKNAVFGRRPRLRQLVDPLAANFDFC